MLYSDLLAQQEKELERLHQEYYADHVTIKKLQDEHYDKTRYDGQLERLKGAHERNVKDAQARFATEQKAFLKEPDALTMETSQAKAQPNISQSQDKAADMIEAYRRQQNELNKSGQQNPSGQPVDEAKLKKLTQQAREKREQRNQQPRRGFRR